jgi:hypothetical protein
MKFQFFQGLVASLAVLLSCGMAALPGSAAVVTNFLNPPLILNVFHDDPQIIEIDLNQDGGVELRLVSSGGGGGGGVTAFRDWPVRLVTKANMLPSGATNFSGVGGLPIGTVFGGTLASDLVDYTWWTGFTNTYDLTAQYGNHEGTLLLAGISGIEGNVVGKEGVIGIEFLIGGLVHYGYVHFDFRLARGYAGGGGYIYGWAYETTPGAPITADRIRSGPPKLDFKITAFAPPPTGNGAAGLTWNAVVGETNRVQASDDLVTWNDVCTNIVVTQDFMSYVTPPAAARVRFFRVVREN